MLKSLKQSYVSYLKEALLMGAIAVLISSSVIAETAREQMDKESAETEQIAKEFQEAFHLVFKINRLRDLANDKKRCEKELRLKRIQESQMKDCLIRISEQPSSYINEYGHLSSSDIASIAIETTFSQMSKYQSLAERGFLAAYLPVLYALSSSTINYVGKYQDEFQPLFQYAVVLAKDIIAGKVDIDDKIELKEKAYCLLAYLYNEGKHLRLDKNKAKEYAGEACDLKGGIRVRVHFEENPCALYKELDEAGY